MMRGKVELKAIENPVSRRVTFSKRKGGLLKKAWELAILCDAELALLIFSPSGNHYEFGSPSVSKILEKYEKFSSSVRHLSPLSETIKMLHSELESLQRRAINLNQNYKHMIGEELNSLSFKELQHLEKKVSSGLRKLRSRKDEILLEHIESSETKGQYLEAENANISKKICRSHKSGDADL